MNHSLLLLRAPFNAFCRDVVVVMLCSGDANCIWQRYFLLLLHCMWLLCCRIHFSWFYISWCSISYLLKKLCSSHLVEEFSYESPFKSTRKGIRGLQRLTLFSIVLLLCDCFLAYFEPQENTLSFIATLNFLCLILSRWLDFFVLKQKGAICNFAFLSIVWQFLDFFATISKSERSWCGLFVPLEQLTCLRIPLLINSSSSIHFPSIFTKVNEKTK